MPPYQLSIITKNNDHNFYINISLEHRIFSFPNHLVVKGYLFTETSLYVQIKFSLFAKCF